MDNRAEALAPEEDRRLLAHVTRDVGGGAVTGLEPALLCYLSGSSPFRLSLRRGTWLLEAICHGLWGVLESPLGFRRAGGSLPLSSFGIWPLYCLSVALLLR